MKPDLSITREAVKILTNPQLEAIKHLLLDDTCLGVFVDFSLPPGYVYFIREKRGNLHTETMPPLHGGIDPEGSVST